MNYNKACDILNLPKTFSQRELRHNYYINALKYHPDKNSGEDSGEKFQEILDAYNYLSVNRESEDSDKEFEKYSYFNILENFINGITDKNVDIKNFINILNNKYLDISLQLLKKLSKDSLLKIRIFIKQYGDILHINETISDTIEKLIKKHIENDMVIVIKPTLENLINDDIYKLSYRDEIYYIPMWHHELVYDISSTSLIVKCEPNIPEYITLDNYNNLYINISMSITSIINQENISINIIDKNYIIPVKDLYIRKYQRYTIKKGISLIDTSNIYNVDHRANIYLDINFMDIN